MVDAATIPCLGTAILLRLVVRRSEQIAFHFGSYRGVMHADFRNFAAVEGGRGRERNRLREERGRYPLR